MVNKKPQSNSPSIRRRPDQVQSWLRHTRPRHRGRIACGSASAHCWTCCCWLQHCPDGGVVMLTVVWFDCLLYCCVWLAHGCPHYSATIWCRYSLLTRWLDTNRNCQAQHMWQCLQNEFIEDWRLFVVWFVPMVGLRKTWSAYEAIRTLVTFLKVTVRRNEWS